MHGLSKGIWMLIALLLCRAVYVAIPVCVAGVILITQPAFLGQATQQRSKIGITLAVGQVPSLLAYCPKGSNANTMQPHTSH